MQSVFANLPATLRMMVTIIRIKTMAGTILKQTSTKMILATNLVPHLVVDDPNELP